MTRLDYSFQLLEYSIVLLAIGMIGGLLLRYTSTGWPKTDKWWPRPLIVSCFILMVVLSIARFVLFVRAFKG